MIVRASRKPDDLNDSGRGFLRQAESFNATFRAYLILLIGPVRPRVVLAAALSANNTQLGLYVMPIDWVYQSPSSCNLSYQEGPFSTRKNNDRILKGILQSIYLNHPQTSAQIGTSITSHCSRDYQPPRQAPLVATSRMLGRLAPDH